MVNCYQSDSIDTEPYEIYETEMLFKAHFGQGIIVFFNPFLKMNYFEGLLFIIFQIKENWNYSWCDPLSKR